MKTLLIIIWTTLTPAGGFSHEVIVFETASYADCQVYALQVKADGAMGYCRGVKVR